MLFCRLQKRLRADADRGDLHDTFPRSTDFNLREIFNFTGQDHADAVRGDPPVMAGPRRAVNDNSCYPTSQFRVFRSNLGHLPNGKFDAANQGLGTKIYRDFVPLSLSTSGNLFLMDRKGRSIGIAGCFWAECGDGQKAQRNGLEEAGDGKAHDLLV